jgi:4'-phosphopantetheinyl transferase
VLLSLPAGLQTRAFFNCWTRKEAYLKAKGEPVFRRVKSIDVTLAPGDPPALLRTSADLQEVSRWSIEALEPAPGYIAALAVEGHDLNITCFAWPFED